MPGPCQPQSYLALPKNLLGNILLVYRYWQVPELVPSPYSVCYKEGTPKVLAEEVPHWFVLLLSGMMFLGQSLHLCHSVELWNGLEDLKWGIGKKRELCLPTAAQKSPHPKGQHLVALVSIGTLLGKKSSIAHFEFYNSGCIPCTFFWHGCTKGIITAGFSFSPSKLYR